MYTDISARIGLVAKTTWIMVDKSFGYDHVQELLSSELVLQRVSSPYISSSRGTLPSIQVLRGSNPSDQMYPTGSLGCEWLHVGGTFRSLRLANITIPRLSNQHNEF